MTGRSILGWQHWRKVRWAALAAAVPALWACNARQLEAPKPLPAKTFNSVFQETVNRDVDIIFMIDNSLSMMPLQAKLATNFPVFMQVLQGLPGGLPNVHIGVVSSSMGAGSSDVPQCPQGGDQGVFQNTARAGCTASGLNPNQHFISNINGTPNYDPTKKIEDVFTCIAQLGQDGCGFEHQFAAVVRALGADGRGPAPAENSDFLRANAFLSIILITNEDDCSAPPDSTLFDPGSRLVSDSLGPLASYRCNEFGHLCNGARPPRTMAATFAPGQCVSAEDGKLLRVADVLAEIKKLKTDPNKILAAAIAGPPDPYVVQLAPPTLKEDPAMWPEIAHSCMQNGGEYADPAVRIKQWIDGFGHNGVFLPICAPSFAPALQRIAEEIGKVLGPKCVQGALVDKDPTMPGVQPDCTVIDHAFNDQAMQIDTVVPACASNGNTPPCWTLTDDAKNCGTNKVLTVNRPAGPVQSDLNSSVACAVCTEGFGKAGCPCVADASKNEKGCF